jgi:mRNA-degrading endonuclease HigB of HigAB toxin-antitoxin module
MIGRRISPKLRSAADPLVLVVTYPAYRLITNINYDAQAVLVLELLTHADYDKEKWKGRY